MTEDEFAAKMQSAFKYADAPSMTGGAFVEALESAGLVHVALTPNCTVFGGGQPARNMTPDEARALARDLLAAADQVEDA